jgi:hypothetical protein
MLLEEFINTKWLDSNEIHGYAALGLQGEASFSQSLLARVLITTELKHMVVHCSGNQMGSMLTPSQNCFEGFPAGTGQAHTGFGTEEEGASSKLPVLAQATRL